MFIPSYRFINFEEFFQPTCLFRPTGLLILSIVYSILQDYYSEDFSNILTCLFHPTDYQFWWIFPTYLLTWLAGASRLRYIVTANALSKIILVQYKSFSNGSIDFGWVQIVLDKSKS